MHSKALHSPLTAPVTISLTGANNDRGKGKLMQFVADDRLSIIQHSDGGTLPGSDLN